MPKSWQQTKGSAAGHPPSQKRQGSTHFPAHHSLLFQPQTEEHGLGSVGDHLAEGRAEQSQFSTRTWCILSYPETQRQERSLWAVERDGLASPCLGYHSLQHSSLGASQLSSASVLRHTHPHLVPGSGVGEDSGIPRFPGHNYHFTSTWSPNHF